MYDAYAYSVWLTQPKAITFVCIGCGIMFLIGLYHIIAVLIKKFKVKNKFLTVVFNTKITIFIALIVGIIIGVIYSSLKNYINLYYNDQLSWPQCFNNGSQLWVWQAVSFNYAVGSWLVTFMLFSLLLILPAISYISLKNIFREKTNPWFNFKKFLWVLLIAGIVLGIMCLMYVIPINAKDTSLHVFSLNKAIDDKFYYSAKWVYENIFFTYWYMWFFIGFLVFNLLFFLLIAYLEEKKGIKIFAKLTDIKLVKNSANNKILHDFNLGKFTLNTMILPSHFFDTTSSIELYAFLSAFMIFNIKSPFVHIGIIMALLIISFMVILILVFFVGVFKFKGKEKQYIRSFFEIAYKKGFYWSKYVKSDKYISDDEMAQKYLSTNYDSLNITHTLVVGIGFTIFLGFTNLTQYQAGSTQIGTHSWSTIMYSGWFWVFTGISAIIACYLLVGESHYTSIAKNTTGSAGWGITPGMQTGTLAWMGSWLARVSKMVDDQIRLVI